MKKNTKILLIDDEEKIRNNIKEYLTFKGFNVISAKDGVEGIQKAIKFQPNLIVCDVMMPNIDGYEVYTSLQDISSTAGIPFIFLTAKVQTTDIRNGMQLGADDYITKPFSFEDLLISINIRLNKIKQFEKVNKEKFDAICKTTLSGVFIYLNNKIIFANEKFVSTIGYLEAEIIKLNIEDIIINKDEKKLFGKNFKNCTNGIQNSFQFTFTIINKNKKLIKIKLFGKSIKIKGKAGIICNTIEIKDELSKNQIYINQVKDKFNSFDDPITNEFVKYIENKNKKEPENITKELCNLSEREVEILKLICEGYTNKEIAEKLFISKRTVEGHRTNLLLKTNTKNTANLVAFSLQNKLIKL